MRTPNMTHMAIVGQLALLIALSVCMSHNAGAAPNVVVIVVDDAGLMDFGGYGGEARTPHIDEIGRRGVRFSNYHTSPLCATSRAMLLTGLDSHRTGMGSLPEVVTESQEKANGYALRLLPGVDTMAVLLREAGYQTYLTGKWHLGSGPGDLPDSHGFDRFFTLDASGADNWEKKSFLPFYAEAPWFEDGEPANLPDDFYSSRFLVNKMIEYLDERERDRPFFAYIAFQAIHIPVQAPREFTDNYRGVYSDGWDSLLERRFERARELGLISPHAKKPEKHPSLKSWSSLDPEEKRHLERRMMVNAGMLEAMDFHVGRLIQWLQAQGEFEDTLIIITSDNGPEFGDPTEDPLFRVWMALNGYRDDLDSLGEKGSMVAIGPEWASAAAAPGSLFKMYASEGGTRVPLIISGPGVNVNGFNNAFSFVTDIAPTILDHADVKPRRQMDGRSLRPLLNGSQDRIYGKDEPVVMEVAGNAFVFLGKYKMTRNTRPHGDGKWRVYDISVDPAETQDISQRNPKLRERLLTIYDEYARRLDVVPLPMEFDVVEQIHVNSRKEILRRSAPNLAAAVLVLMIAILLLVRRRRSRSNKH